MDSSAGHFYVIIRACTENYLVAKIKATKTKIIINIIIIKYYVQILSKTTKNTEQRERRVGNGES